MQISTRGRFFPTPTPLQRYENAEKPVTEALSEVTQLLSEYVSTRQLRIQYFLAGVQTSNGVQPTIWPILPENYVEMKRFGVDGGFLCFPLPLYTTTQMRHIVTYSEVTEYVWQGKAISA